VPAGEIKSRPDDGAVNVTLYNRGQTSSRAEATAAGRCDGRCGRSTRSCWTGVAAAKGQVRVSNRQKEGPTRLASSTYVHKAA